jgi:hypothetical protein
MLTHDHIAQGLADEHRRSLIEAADRQTPANGPLLRPLATGVAGALARPLLAGRRGLRAAVVRVRDVDDRPACDRSIGC